MAIKMSYVMNVINGEPFIYYQLMSIYPHAHEIIITEGAYGKLSHASTSDGHSTDKTLDTIANFPDPEHKITLIEHQGFWNERCEMCNGFMSSVTGDVIWQVDVDEFYLPHVHEYVARLFDEDDALDRVSFRVREFFASPNYEVVGAVSALGLSDVRRVHRFEKGDQWITQRPPTLIDTCGKLKPIRKEISAEELFKKGMFIFHYTTLFEKQFFDKFKYYRQMWKGIEQTDKWLNDTWYHFKNPLRLFGTTSHASWIERYEGSHPPMVEQMLIDVRNGKYPNIVMRNNFDIEGYLQSRRYHEDVLMGRRLNSFHVNLGKKELLPAIEDLLFIFCNFIRSPFRVTYRYCVFGALKAFLLAMLAIPKYFVRGMKRSVFLACMAIVLPSVSPLS